MKSSADTICKKIKDAADTEIGGLSRILGKILVLGGVGAEWW